MAVLYCFLNGEVITELTKKWQRRSNNWPGSNGRGFGNSSNGVARRDPLGSMARYGDGEATGGGRHTTSGFCSSTTCLSGVGKSRAGSMTGSTATPAANAPLAAAIVTYPVKLVTLPFLLILSNSNFHYSCFFCFFVVL